MPFLNKKILYLEDEVLIAYDGEYVLRQLGFQQITITYSLEQAERAASSEHFDLALLDINLGGGHNSLDFATRLFERGMKIIFTSGYNRTESLTGNLPVLFIEKPINAEKIKVAVDQIFT